MISNCDFSKQFSQKYQIDTISKLKMVLIKFLVQWFTQKNEQNSINKNTHCSAQNKIILEIICIVKFPNGLLNDISNLHNLSSDHTHISFNFILHYSLFHRKYLTSKKINRKKLKNIMTENIKLSISQKNNKEKLAGKK